MQADASYPPTPGTTFNRKKHRGTYDAETIHNIVNTSSVCHVGFQPPADDAFPVVLPMIGQIAVYPPDSDEPPACYLHGYVSSRLMKLGADGLPVCIEATKVDGFTMALTPFNHSYNYRSAMLQGRATIVEDRAEKLWAMELITDAVVPGRWAHTRVPPDGGEMQSTRIMKVAIERASAKVKGHVPSDERKDLRNDDVVNSVWTGIIPAYEAFGEPVPSPYNRVQEVPSHIADFVRNENLNAKEFATDAACRAEPASRGGS
ncbi:putative flavin-nucleotide-binding protein [Neofusicoccum parvum]|uniref:Putative flavin-nucleotide-binding protein n=1 Tax=Botryosphaeria parva (strain UCR-NP2) TaxID=1287680 RepID=R1EEX2_BOTPV|nr:putative flavin-nucleotide-binding protein [Neofusicoccum parvum UCRNP2]GME30691.1 putative flavin-nucleotide-binding protein [Neofusicoccum parvum]